MQNRARAVVFLVLIPGCPSWWGSADMPVEGFTGTTAETTGWSTAADEPTSGSSTSNSFLTTSSTLTEGETTSVGPVCGDGIPEADESCDDGNSDNTDACTDSCALPRCGDAFIQAGEECDDGNSDNTDACTDSCALPRCGDAFIQAGEACDDGNKSDSDACTRHCDLAYCGDGFVRLGLEQCDDAQLNSDAGSCTTMCKIAVCGDGLVHENFEECDRGWNLNDASCDGYCKLVHRVVFVTAPTSGNLGGLVGADQFCRTTAADANLTNATSFMAWLHDGNTGPSDRFDHGFTGIYELVNGAIITHDGWSGLTDALIDTAINLQADGEPAAEDSSVWTNTMPNGVDPIHSSGSCNGWKSATVEYLGRTGGSGQIDGRWTNNTTVFTCQVKRPIYCFEGKS